MYIKRILADTIVNFKTAFPILVVTGPRQSGKTTMLKALFPNYRYVSLENPDNRDFALTDPNGFLQLYDKEVIFDEVQQAPQLFSYLQAKVDASGMMGQFILSGSQNFNLMASITQSLAGRVAIFRLLPLSHAELHASALLAENYAEQLIKGYYPAIYDRNIHSKVYYFNYIESYVERDLTQLLHVKDLAAFRRFLKACAARVGQLLNLTALGNECGISQPTAKSWLSILQSSYIVFQLEPYHENLSKRLSKSPKLYFYDTGLLAYLLGFDDPVALQANPIKGSLFENMVIAERLKQQYNQYLPQEIFFWRDHQGNEVDLIIPQNGLLNMFEIKATQTVNSGLFKGLNYLASTLADKLGKQALIYTGNEAYTRNGIQIVPWNSFDGI